MYLEREGYLDQAVTYAQLEQGARYLAARAVTAAERQEHLGWANRYYRLRAEFESEAMPSPLRAAA